MSGIGDHTTSRSDTQSASDDAIISDNTRRCRHNPGSPNRTGVSDTVHSCGSAENCRNVPSPNNGPTSTNGASNSDGNATNSDDTQLCCCCCKQTASHKQRGGLPPGPGGLPLLGASHRWEGPQTNLEWARQYGPIYSVRMGSTQLVYLNTIDLVEEYMERKGATLLGRPEGPAAIANGLLFGQGDRWRENRHAFVRAMWQSSFTQQYEHIVMQEVDHVLQQLSTKLGKPLELRQLLLPAVSHRLVTVLLGQPVDRDGEDMVTLVEQMTLLSDHVDLMSFASNIFLKVKRFRRFLQCVSRQTIPDMFKMSDAEQTLIRGWIVGRRAALTQSGGQPDPRSLLDHLLTSQEYVSRNEEFDQELIQSVMDLFNGGVATILSVLDFALLNLLHHPHIQYRMRAEIHAAIAHGHIISWAQRHHFPYTHATLIEALRLASVTPSTLPHMATEDMVIEDYVVPRDVVVVASIYTLHRDPRYYDDAEVFRPERHLDNRGRVVEPKSFRPFGVGERMCLGYRMAEVELFLYLARLFSNFHFRAEDPSHPPPFRTMMRVVRRLEPFTCVAERWDSEP